MVAVDAPVGQNAAFQRVLDAMTDLEMAPEMGVWRLLEDGSGTLAVHAALLHTGDVLFFAGSSNDPDRHNAHQFGTTVWRYPGAEQQQPDTPVDLFCCGHAFLPDGRLLAAGGTQQYDPFFGLTQSIAFDPATRTWVPQPQMAGGRWYPSLLALGDGRVLAASGLDGTSQLNLVPEIYTDGAGWATRPQSPHWPHVRAPVPAGRRARVLQRWPVRRQQRRAPRGLEPGRPTPPPTSPACPTPAAATSPPACSCRPRRPSG